jgi:hypothetical protein
VEGVAVEERILDLRVDDDWAAAIGSPQVVSANVGNPPSTGRKIPGGEAGLRDSEEMDGDWELSLWRPFPCLDEGAGAASASGPVDLSLRVDDGGEVDHALAVLRLFDTDRPGAGHCELVPLAEVVVV